MGYPKPKKGPKVNEKSKKDKKDKKGGQTCKSFPMEKGPDPSQLRPTEITWLYKIPDAKFKTEDDVVEHHGYKMEQKLDAGGFGVIYFARNKKNVKEACKLMNVGSNWKGDRVIDMKNELFIMKKVKHLYIIKVHAHFMIQTDSGTCTLFIFMELADGGNLAKFIEKRMNSKGNLSEKEAKQYYAQIICGINHIHSLGIAHRDLKPQNILLKSNEKSISGDFTLLLADFGLSRIIHHEDDGAVEDHRTYCGTPIFMCPELLLHKPYNAFQADMWALGVILFIMMTNGTPFNFKDQNNVIQDMLDRKWNWPTTKMKSAPSSDLKSMTSSLLEPDSTKRLTIQSQCRHKWVANEFQKAQTLANKSKSS